MTPWRTEALPLWLARGVAALGVAVLGVWLVRPSWVPLLFGATTPTKPVTALCFALLGGVLSGLVRRPALRAGVLAAVGLMAAGRVADALGAPTLLVGRLLPVDWGRWTPDGDGRMAVGTAVALAGVALALARPHRGWWTALFALPAFVLGYAAVLGYLYGASGLYSLQSETAMAMVTAVGLQVLAAGVLLQPATPLARLVGSPAIAGSLTRRLLPWALGVPPVAGWLRLVGEEQRLFDPRFGIAVMVLAATGGMVLMVLMGARTAHRVDAARERAASGLEALNAELSERVAAAVGEVEAGKERLRLLLEHTPAGIFETGPDGVRRYVNARWCEIAGLTPAQAAGEGWTHVIHPDDRDWVRAQWAAALEAGREWSARYRYLRPDGEVVYVDVVAVAVRDAAGEVGSWLGSVTDVTTQVYSEQRLQESELRYRTVVTSMREGVVLHDADGVIVTVNDAACVMLGASAEELVGTRGADLGWDLSHEDGSPFATDDLPSQLVLTTGRPARDVTMRVRRSDGGEVWLSVNSEPLITGRSGSDSVVVTGAVTTLTDVTATRQALRALRRSEEQFRTAMEHAPVGMALVDLDGRFREVNRELVRLTGFSEQQLVTMTMRQLCADDDGGLDAAALAPVAAGDVDHLTGEHRVTTRDGTVLWMLVAVSCVREVDRAPARLVVQLQDVTVSRAERVRLAHRAAHDPLTGLPNRDMVMDHLAHALARGARSNTGSAVMFCDLDGFKPVNDTHGHDAGDRLLVAVAERLLGVVRPGDVVGRLGGDEFVVIAEGLVDGASVRGLGERVRQALAEPVVVDGVVLAVSGSVGVVVAGPGDDARAVLREADAAMYRAKARGRNRVEMSDAPPELAEAGAPLSD